MTLRTRLLQQFAEDHPAEAAAILNQQSDADAAAVLATLSETAAARVLERAAAPMAARALARLDDDRAGRLLAALPLERGAALLRQLEPGGRDRLLATLPRAEQLRSLLEYPRGTAGALMDPSILALPRDLDLVDARRRLGELSAHLALELFVVDTDHRLVGFADLREVLDGSRHGPLATLTRTLAPLSERADLAALATHPAWLHHDTLPVVDDRGTYLGAVRGERIRQHTQEAAARRSRGGADAVGALGELFWLGLTGLFSSLRRPSEEETR